MRPLRLPALVSFALALAALPVAAQTQVWVRQFGTTEDEYTCDAVSDGAGGVLVTGQTFGSLGGPAMGMLDVWLARYDSVGNLLWVSQFGSWGEDHVVRATEDGMGGLYLGGYTDQSLGGQNAGYDDAWLARYDGAGNRLWIRQFGSTGSDDATAFASDGAGGVYASGSTTGSLGGPSTGYDDAWVARYDGAGNRTWIRKFGSSERERVYAAVPDGSGGVYVSGDTNGSLVAPFLGGYDGWLAHYDGAGNQLWVLQFGTVGIDFPCVAAPDGSGGLFLGGYTNGSLGGPNAGDWDAWLARYDSAGNRLWILQFGTSQADTTIDATPDGSGGAYLSGSTWGSLGGPSAGGGDAWLARYDSAGNRLWISQLGSSVLDHSYAAASDASGRLYIAGHTEGSLGGPNAGKDDAWLARYEPGPPPGTYCTGKVSSSRCLPAMSWSGGPSLALSDSFLVRCDSMEANRTALLFFGLTGPTSLPFHGGTLCVGGALPHLPGTSTGGAGACTGSLRTTLTQFLATPAGAQIAAGSHVWCQAWSRDPADAWGSSLSDALTFEVCP